MSRTRGFLLAGVILLGSFGIATLLIAQRPEPERRDPPSQIPFVTTAPAVAGSGAIPVHGAGTVRPRVQVDLAAGVSGRVVWVDPAFESGGPGQRGTGPLPPRRRRLPLPGGAGAFRGHRSGGGTAEGRGRSRDRPRAVRGLPEPRRRRRRRRGESAGAVGAATRGRAGGGGKGARGAGGSRASPFADRGAGALRRRGAFREASGSGSS